MIFKYVGTQDNGVKDLSEEHTILLEFLFALFLNKLNQSTKGIALCGSERARPDMFPSPRMEGNPGILTRKSLRDEISGAACSKKNRLQISEE